MIDFGFVVIQADNDRDFMIDKDKIDNLLMQLKSIEGVDFSESNFCRAIAKAGYDVDKLLEGDKGLDLEIVLAVTKNLMDDWVPHCNSIFYIEPQKLLPEELRMLI